MSAAARQDIRLLVVLPNWLGDLIMTMPLVDLLSRARDQDGRPFTLFVSVRRRWAPLLTRDSRLAALLVYERTGRHAGLRGVPPLAEQWRAAHVTTAILCPPSLRVALVARLARIPRRIGYAGEGRGKLLTLPLDPVRPRGRMHYADEMRRTGLAFLETLGLALPDGAAAYPTLPGLAALEPAWLGAGPPVWILAPGATYGPAKTWPVPRAAELVTRAVREQGVRLAVVGDTATTGYLAELRRRVPDLPWRRDLPGPAGVVDLVGATTLLDLAALLKASAAFVGNDSGVMHLAAALGLPTLGLFGSSSLAWTAPRGPRAQALVANGFPCQPCFRKTCNRPVFCLDALTGREVFQALRTLVDSPANGVAP